MEPDTQPQPVVSPPNHPTAKYWAAILILLVAAAAACYGVYSWQHNKVEDLSSHTDSSQTASALAAPAKSSGAATNYSTNVAVGYPLSLPKKKVLVTLNLPASNSILQEAFNARTQDELASNYTESFNDVLANWFFNSNGTPANPSNSATGNQNITITALNNWASTPDSSGVAYPTLGPQTTGPMTTAQKSTFITSLKTQSASCATDSAKGFATNDKVFDVCVSLRHPQGQGGNWIMDLSGYANISGTNSYLRGFIYLPFTGYQAVEAQYIQALKNTTTVVQDNNQ